MRAPLLACLVLLSGCYVLEVGSEPLADDDDASADDLAPDDDDSAADVSNADDDVSNADDDDSTDGPPDDGASPDDDDAVPSPACPSWTFDGDAGGWTLGPDLLVDAVQDGSGTRFVASGDPWMWTDASADMDACSRVEAVFAVDGPDANWELFWRRDGEPGFAGTRRHGFEAFVDGTLNRYVFDLADHPEWTGGLSALRFDPTTGDGSVTLVSLALLDATEPIAPPLDLGAVHWLHADVSGWSETADLYNVALSDSMICLEHDRAAWWPTVDIDGEGTHVNANPWIFVWKPDLVGGGTWYGATWEWMRPSMPCKARSAVHGTHIKQPPFHAESGWAPSAGETIWFAVSGLARTSDRTVEERSQLVPVTWEAP